MFNLKPKIENLKFPRNEGGYTAIELMIAIGIMGILIFGAVTMYKLVSRSFWQVDEKSRLQRALVFSMEQVTQDLRQAVSVITIGPVVVGGTPVTVWGTPYAAASIVQAMPMTSVSLNTAGTNVFRFRVPNLTDPLKREYDAIITYFLRTMPNGTVKLYKDITYYDLTRSQAIPVFASVDQYRLGKAVTVAPLMEPTPRAAPTHTPLAAATAVPSSFNNMLGKMPGVFDSPHLNFDDVTFFYNKPTGIVAVALTLSYKSKSLSWMPGALSRRRLTLTSTVAMRRTQ